VFASVALAVLGSPAFAREGATGASPFAPGGPLAPWGTEAPAGGAPSSFQGSAAGGARGMRWRPAAAVGQDSAPDGGPSGTRRGVEGAGDAEQTYVAVLANPALVAFGKMSGRIEVAPLAAHAFFFEASRISLFVDEVKQQARGWEYDFGYHLFPQGQGAYGFYLGPRVLVARGESDAAVGRFLGFGGDLGYQFVIARHVVINLGAGVARVEASAELKPSEVARVAQMISDDTGSLGTQASTSTSKSFWLPLATAGLGVAF
jgi:hypothetical protein